MKPRHPPQVLPGEGPLRLVRDRVRGRLDPRGAPRRRLQQLPPVLHGQAEHHRHGRPGRALPAPPRAPGPRLTRGRLAGRSRTTARRRPTRAPFRFRLELSTTEREDAMPREADRRSSTTVPTTAVASAAPSSCAARRQADRPGPPGPSAGADRAPGRSRRRLSDDERDEPEAGRRGRRPGRGRREERQRRPRAQREPGEDASSRPTRPTGSGSNRTAV